LVAVKAVVVRDRRAIQRQLIDLRGREHLLELHEVREGLTDEGIARSEHRELRRSASKLTLQRAGSCSVPSTLAVFRA